MTAEFVRDAAGTTAVLGFFAAGWFGWAQDAPPAGWRLWLTGGSVAGMITALAGGLLTWSHWTDGSAITSETGPIFGLIVAVEVVLSAAGAAVLHRRGQSRYIPAWVAVIVGLHLLPLAPLFRYPFLWIVGAAVTLIGLAAIPIASARSLPVSAVTGVAVGTVLLSSALVSLAWVVL